MGQKSAKAACFAWFVSWHGTWHCRSMYGKVCFLGHATQHCLTLVFTVELQECNSFVVTLGSDDSVEAVLLYRQDTISQAEPGAGECCGILLRGVSHFVNLVSRLAACGQKESYMHFHHG